MYMSVTIALKPLDTFSWSTVEGLGVNQETESHTTTCGFTLVNSNLRQRSNSVFLTYYQGYLCFWVGLICYPII